MITEHSVVQLLRLYGIDYLSLDDDAKVVIDKNGNLEMMTSALDFLVNYLGVSPKRIEKCPSVLYLNPSFLKSNYEYLINKGINKEKIIGCLHILSSNPKTINETYDYVIENYGVETFNKNISILGIPVHRIKEMEVFSSRISKKAILSAAITTLRVPEINDIINICEEFGVEVSGSFFQKGVREIAEIVKICKDYNLDVSGSMFRKSSFELKKIIDICKKEGVPITGSVFLKDSDAIVKIIDICRSRCLPITGSVFRRDAGEIDQIIKVCEELGIPVSGTVFLRDADEIKRIYAVCQKYGIEISANIFKKNADEIEDIVRVCQKYNINITSTLFKKSASSLDKSMSYILEKFGRSYLVPLVVVIDKNHLQKVFPYLDSKGMLPAVIVSPAILSLNFDELVEREMFINKLGESHVVGGRCNSVYGLSKRKYAEKKEKFKFEGMGIK